EAGVRVPRHVHVAGPVDPDRLRLVQRSAVVACGPLRRSRGVVLDGQVVGAAAAAPGRTGDVDVAGGVDRHRPGVVVDGGTGVGTDPQDAAGGGVLDQTAGRAAGGAHYDQ